MTLSIIVAKAENNVIGNNNTLIWHLPADLKYFKNLTTGNTIIMGRKTYDSIGKPLPNRRNIVISRNTDLKIAGCEVVNSLDEALKMSGNEEHVFIIGGAEIYKQALNKVDTLYITEVKSTFEGDAFLDEISPEIWHEVSREDHLADEKNKVNYSFVTYKRTLI
ncbi:dihydrofolate reductase [Solitalea sp. MAHUQ-68]|uniref:Dihydrofolate reductase n=1 Tax=Solitalea agri TaxID=2953739 RepID=A0A9X2EZN7_9SPHI|nr:dihydrofolate reductase [Solitalea agri]MCO4291435.1 dihydrofolate reductase [Solitalea agri]